MGRKQAIQTLDGDPKASTQPKERKLVATSHVTKKARHLMDVYNQVLKDGPMTMASMDGIASDTGMSEGESNLDGGLGDDCHDTTMEFDLPPNPTTTTQAPEEPIKAKLKVVPCHRALLHRCNS